MTASSHTHDVYPLLHPIDTYLSRNEPHFEDSEITSDDLERINRLAPAKLSADQVYVRSMYLCSTQPCLSDGCQFSKQGLEDIAGKIVGQSVLTGHDRSRLPLARFFKARVVEGPSVSASPPVYFVRAWFYWLRGTTGAKDLLLNIDGGIYREVSLSWRFNRWHCSICHAENNRCAHRVGDEYDGKICFRLIHSIAEVLEGSLVYKSADKNTLLTGARHALEQTRSGTIVLIARPGDPLFQKLRELDAIVEIQTIDEPLESPLNPSGLWWIRSSSETSARRFAQELLPSGGFAYGEWPEAGEDRSRPCSTSIFKKLNDGSVLQSHHDSEGEST